MARPRFIQTSPDHFEETTETRYLCRICWMDGRASRHFSSVMEIQG